MNFVTIVFPRLVSSLELFSPLNTFFSKNSIHEIRNAVRALSKTIIVAEIFRVAKYLGVVHKLRLQEDVGK